MHLVESLDFKLSEEDFVRESASGEVRAAQSVVGEGTWLPGSGHDPAGVDTMQDSNTEDAPNNSGVPLCGEPVEVGNVPIGGRAELLQLQDITALCAARPMHKASCRLFLVAELHNKLKCQSQGHAVR